MSVSAGRKYKAEVAWASLIESQRTGTLGIEIGFKTDDGPITATLWLSSKQTEGGQKNRDVTKGNLKTMGATDEDLESETFWTDPGARLRGAIVQITTYQDDYDPLKPKTKVQYINEWKERAPGEEGQTPAQRAAGIFGARPRSAAPLLPADTLPENDEDVPFGG